MRIHPPLEYISANPRRTIVVTVVPVHPTKSEAIEVIEVIEVIGASEVIEVIKVIGVIEAIGIGAMGGNEAAMKAAAPDTHAHVADHIPLVDIERSAVREYRGLNNRSTVALYSDSFVCPSPIIANEMIREQCVVHMCKYIVPALHYSLCLNILRPGKCSYLPYC